MHSKNKIDFHSKSIRRCDESGQTKYDLNMKINWVYKISSFFSVRNTDSVGKLARKWLLAGNKTRN